MPLLGSTWARADSFFRSDLNATRRARWGWPQGDRRPDRIARIPLKAVPAPPHGAGLACGKSQREVAIALAKSTAWVSRRLALVRALPEVAQEAVRVGRIGASAAEKYLVPLSRGNAGQCAQLVEGLRTVKPTARQLLCLYTAWKAANDDVRQRIAEHPLLHLKVDQALQHKDAEDAADLTAVRDVEAIAGVCGRARRGLREGAYVRLREEHRAQFVSAWQEAQLAFDAVRGLVRKEGDMTRREKRIAILEMRTHGVSIRGIADALDASRNTVREVIASGDPEAGVASSPGTGLFSVARPQAP